MQTTEVRFDPVDMFCAAPVFEYLDLSAALMRIASLVARGGILGTVLQLPSAAMPAVTPSPFQSLERLAPVIRLVRPEQLRAAAEPIGFSEFCRAAWSFLRASAFKYRCFAPSSLAGQCVVHKECVCLPQRGSPNRLEEFMPSKMPGKRLRADLALTCCALIWGATFVVIKDALADVSVVAYIAVRFSLAAFVMAIVYWRSLRGLTFKTVWAGAQIGIFMFCGYVFQIVGLKFTTPSKTAFVTGTFVVFVPILLFIFARRRIAGWVWGGAVVVLAGLYFLTVPSEGFGGLNRGDPIVFGCAVMFALHMIFIGRYVHHHSVAALSFLQVATTAVLALLVLPIVSAAGWEQPKLVWTGNLVFAILLTAIGATVICFSLQTWAQQYAAPSHAAILVSLEPVFAALTSLALGREHLGARVLFGALLILAGIVLAEWKAAAPAIPASSESAIASTE
jgi:drug/metabolite transporter (DMT)-like permease